jgi:hypothetical protein
MFYTAPSSGKRSACYLDKQRQRNGKLRVYTIVKFVKIWLGPQQGTNDAIPGKGVAKMQLAGEALERPCGKSYRWGDIMLERTSSNAKAMMNNTIYYDE